MSEKNSRDSPDLDLSDAHRIECVRQLEVSI
eukprot:UN19899